MSPRPPLLCAALATLVLAGCSTPGSGPAAPIASAPVIPPAPAVVVDARPASILGSQETSTLLDNFTAFITAVDGVPVAAGRQGWNQPIALPPGPRRLTVEFNRGVFLARAELALDAKPGAAYELRHASDAQVYGAHTWCEFWIVDLATGEKTGPGQRTALSTVKPPG